MARRLAAGIRPYPGRSSITPFYPSRRAIGTGRWLAVLLARALVFLIVLVSFNF
jgi:hypothetical protein